MRTQLKVLKGDGSLEEYFHTKVMGTISLALDGVNQTDICVAEHLADVVTYFLYHKHDRRDIASSDIFSIIKLVLTATGHEKAAIELSEHQHQRKLKRSRIEVVAIEIKDFSDIEELYETKELVGRSRWDKTRIVFDLVSKHDIDKQTARTIASMVEEKIFSMGISQIPMSLIKQLVWSDAALVLKAERQLQTV